MAEVADMRKRLSQAEAAAVAGCSARTLARALTAGERASIREHGRVLVDLADLRRWIEQRNSRQASGRRATPLGQVSGRVLRALRFEVEAIR